MKLLLDTCSFLWFIRDDASVSSRARAIIRDSGNEVYLSAASAWEIAIKHALGRLPLPSPPRVFVPTQRENHQIDRLDIGEDAALQIAALPAHHKDPFDRILVAQAIMEGLTVVTPDPLIAQYPVRCEW